MLVYKMGAGRGSRIFSNFHYKSPVFIDNTLLTSREYYRSPQINTSNRVQESFLGSTTDIESKFENIILDDSNDNKRG